MDIKTIVSKIKSILRGERPIIKRPVNSFLRKVSGVIHVGANSGQERETYDTHGLRVFWVEPIPEIFRELQENIREYPGQRAANYLVSDQNGREYQFHVANNKGESSSIFDLKHHKDIWPKIDYERNITLVSMALPAVLAAENVDPVLYDALVMDTQGAELLILKGASAVLENFRFIKLEAPDFEAYEGCCQLFEVEDFLSAFGYREYARFKFKEWKQGGGYYDVVYRRNDLLAFWKKVNGTYGKPA
jgi:FkbM family methyltransferase